MKRIYLDKNIIGYLQDKTLQFTELGEIEWIYSTEHLTEIERSGMLELLEELEKIKARRIKIELDKKFKITNNAIIEEYRTPSEVFEEYKTAISENPVDFEMTKLLAFFYGNVNAINIEDFIQSFEKTIKALTDNAFDLFDDNSLKLIFNNSMRVISEEFKKTLLKAKEQLKPLNELRKEISNKQFSDLLEEDGPIIDQIWNEIKEKCKGITKDKLFGKESFMENDQFEKKPLYLKIISCYSVLNHLGYCPDKKVSKVSKIYGVNSDASHVGHSSYCDVILSEDKRLCKKANAIFQYLNVGTQIFHLKINKA